MLYLLRHCAASGQSPDAPLTEAGRAQAEGLVAAFADLPLTTILSSPWTRALQSVEPLARARNVEVRTDPRLTEYVLAPHPRDDWREQLRANFAEPARAVHGGESVRAAADRIAAVLGALDPETGALVVTHGGLLAAFAQSLHPGVGFDFWGALGTPSLLVYDGRRLVERALGV